MARPWSARCYGVARQREGSRPNSIGGSGVLSLRHFSGWFSLSLGAWVPKNLARRRMVSAARCCSTGSGRQGGAAAAVVNLICLPYARAREVFLNSAQPSRGGSQRNRRPPWWPRLDQLTLVKIAPTSLPLRLAT